MTTNFKNKKNFQLYRYSYNKKDMVDQLPVFYPSVFVTSAISINGPIGRSRLRRELFDLIKLPL